MTKVHIRPNTFHPFSSADFGVVVLHNSRFSERWKWFWPQYIESVPPQILGQTTVVYHQRDHEATPVPPAVESVRETSELIVLHHPGRSIHWSMMEALKTNRRRIIARVQDDIQFIDDGWVQEALELFKQQPHLRILGVPTPSGPDYGGLASFCEESWMRHLLWHGDYSSLTYIHGCFIIANRTLWLAYLPRVYEWTRFNWEDIALSILAMGDGVQFNRFTGFFKHIGVSQKDEIRLWTKAKTTTPQLGP